MAPLRLDQAIILEKLEKLPLLTKNFPSLIHEAEATSLINRIEKDAILTKYKSVYDKITTFYLLVSSRDMTKLQSVLEHTGNSDQILNYLLHDNSNIDNSLMFSPSPNLTEMGVQIMSNLDRLCSHTENVGLVLSFACGMGLISGFDRELIGKRCNHSPSQVLESFYSFVAAKGTQAQDTLVQVLKLTNNHWALQILHQDDEYQEEEEGEDLHHEEGWEMITAA